MTSVIGRRIRQRLFDLDRGPNWLARKLGRHPTTVSSWLAGRHTPSIQQLQAIAEVLGCNTAWLLGEHEQGLVTGGTHGT